MRLAASGAVVTLAAVLAGCGGDGNSRRDAVNAYLDRVNQAQAPLANRQAAINGALRRFSLTKTSVADATTLVRGEREMRRTIRAIRAIAPPPEARELHADQLRLLGLEASVTGELVWATRYGPQLVQAERPLGPISRRLARDLAEAKKDARLIAAFARYRRSLAAVLARLDRLSAPPTMRPSLVGERRLLRRSIVLCVAIE